MFQDNFIKGCFKNLLMKFCFAILLLHESHCSYPSRRRAFFLTIYYFRILDFRNIFQVKNTRNMMSLGFIVGSMLCAPKLVLSNEN